MGALPQITPRSEDFGRTEFLKTTMAPTILIADDYDDNRELLRLMLAADGYRIREARNGREAVEEALISPPDLALIDLSMPKLDGWGALAELRADPRTRAVPCVAVTAFASEQDRRRALEAGFDSYISKPFRAKDLLELVARFVGARREAAGAETEPAGVGSDLLTPAEGTETA